MIKWILLVFLGGGVGSTARFLLHYACTKWWPSAFPVGTLLINLLGSLLIGFFFVLAGKTLISNDARLFLVVGVCGGFTTFSAFSLESLQLLKNGEWLYFAGYIALSIILCIFSVWMGDFIAKTLVGK